MLDTNMCIGVMLKFKKIRGRNLHTKYEIYNLKLRSGKNSLIQVFLFLFFTPMISFCNRHENIAIKLLRFSVM